ncbi:MAG: hypothetical protein K2H85_11585, partial [Allobaculum sp.]|nr:hypothetical protein [Allobaculum sp.]
MKLIISFLEEQGIEDFDTDCVRVKSSYGEKLKEFIVLDDEFFVCEEGESLWSSNPNSFEFTLLHADQKTERCQNKVFRIPTQDFSIKE